MTQALISSQFTRRIKMHLTLGVQFMAHDFFHGLMSIGQSEGQCSCQILQRCKFLESVTIAKEAQLYRAAKCPRVDVF